MANCQVTTRRAAYIFNCVNCCQTLHSTSVLGLQLLLSRVAVDRPNDLFQPVLKYFSFVCMAFQPLSQCSEIFAIFPVF